MLTRGGMVLPFPTLTFSIFRASVKHSKALMVSVVTIKNFKAINGDR